MEKIRDMTCLNEGGYVETTVEELTGLSSEQVYLIDLRIALTKSVRERRINTGLSQAGLARKMGSSQSRVAIMESYGPNVSLDLLIRALLALAIMPTELGALIASVPAPMESVAK